MMQHNCTQKYSSSNPLQYQPKDVIFFQNSFRRSQIHKTTCLSAISAPLPGKPYWMSFSDQDLLTKIHRRMVSVRMTRDLTKEDSYFQELIVRFNNKIFLTQTSLIFVHFVPLIFS